MSDVTESERATWPDKPIVELPEAFVDQRGSIQPLVDLDMKSCVLIKSVEGSVRANHYHKTDWHFCYLLEGELAYYHRPQGSLEAPEKIIVKPGQMIFTPPLVEHAMVFLADSVFLTLGRNSRCQKAYEADVVRVAAINPELRGND